MMELLGAFVLMAYTGNVAPGTYTNTIYAGSTTEPTPGGTEFSAGIVTYDPEGASTNTMGAANAADEQVSTSVTSGWEVSDLYYNGSLAPDNTSPTTLSTSPSAQVKSQIYDLYHQGNTTDDIRVQVVVDSITYSGSSTWTVEILDASDTSLASGNVSAAGESVTYDFLNQAANSQIQYKIAVTPPADAADSDEIVLYTWASTTKDSDAGYTPFNDADNWPDDSKYDESANAHSALGDQTQCEGDGAEEEDYTNKGYLKVVCKGPRVYVSKSVDVTSGALPFDTITYTIQFDNDGNGGAENFTITEILNTSLVSYVDDSARTNNTYPTDGANSEDFLMDWKTGGAWENDWDLDGVDDEPATVEGIKWQLTGDSGDADGDGYSGGDGILNAQENSEGTDSVGAVDGDIPDDDAGAVQYKVKIK